MQVSKKGFDKLNDIDKIKINSYLSVRSSQSNSLLVCAMILVAFSLHNLLLLNFLSSMIFLVLSAFSALKGIVIRINSEKAIEDSYFRIDIKSKRKKR